MTDVLLGLLVIETGILVYGWLREFRASENYRTKHLERREEELDVALLNVVRLRELTRPVVASKRADEQRDRDESRSDEVAHNSSFPGWDK